MSVRLVHADVLYLTCTVRESAGTTSSALTARRLVASATVRARSIPWCCCETIVHATAVAGAGARKNIFTSEVCYSCHSELSACHTFKAQLRMNRILPVLDPSIRERIKTQDFFQVLESREPSLSQMPPRALRGGAKFWISRWQNRQNP